MSNLFIQIGKKIQEFLDISGMSQTELAAKIGVSKQVMNKIIHGKKAINVDEVTRIASVINVSVGDLMRYEDYQKTYEPVLIMMGKVEKANTKDDLRFLNHVMDEMIALQELLKS